MEETKTTLEVYQKFQKAVVLKNGQRKRKMPRIFFNYKGRKYSMIFTQEGNNKFAVVTSDKGGTKRIIYEGYHCEGKRTVVDFFNSVGELFAGE